MFSVYKAPKFQKEVDKMLTASEQDEMNKFIADLKRGGGLVSKGDIKVNHFIRNEPAHARATVVVHELYHYWDKKIARNAYPNVSYGMIGAGTQHIHEYDAYLATSIYWEMVKKEGDASPLAKLLDGIPTDPGAVRELVDSKVGGRK
jgi:hypothetical protein